MVLLLIKDKVMCKKCGKAILINIMRIYSGAYDGVVPPAGKIASKKSDMRDISALNFISGCKLDTENLWRHINGNYTHSFKQQIDYLEMTLGSSFYDDHLPTMRKNFSEMLERYTIADSLLNTILAACKNVDIDAPYVTDVLKSNIIYPKPNFVEVWKESHK